MLRPHAGAIMAAVVTVAPHGLRAQAALERLGDASSVPVSAISSVPLGTMRIATAVRSGDAMRVSAWDVDSAGTVREAGFATAGSTDRIAAAQTGRNRLVTAVRTAGGALRLISWHVAANGTVTRKGNADAGPMQEVAVAAVDRTMIVTAVRDAASELTLISWRVDTLSGAMTRLDSAAFGKLTMPRVVALAPGRLVVAGRGASGRLVLRALDVGTGGTFQSRSTVGGAAITEVALATVSVERVVTAARRSADGSLAVTTWGVTPQGTLSQRSEITAGAATSIAVTTRGAAQALAALQQSDGTLRLIAYDAIGALSRLGSIDAGAVAQVTAVTIGRDRYVTPVRGSDGALKVIAWRDRAVPLLRGQWGPAVRMQAMPQLGAVDENTPTFDDADPSPAGGSLRPTGFTAADDRPEVTMAGDISPPLTGAAIRTGVNSSGYDPMLAVGHKFIVVTQDHQVAFFDREGRPLPKRGRQPVKLDAAEFFAAFLARKNADGTPNEQNINRHLGIGPWNAECDLVAQNQPCIDEMYDTRVVYDRTSRRFVIVSAARAGGMSFEKDSTKETDPAVRRYFAVAVSKTEDPRDGFWQYMTTTSNYADWPRVVAQHGMVVVAHDSYSGIFAREGPAATTFIFAMDSLRTGAARIPSWQLYADQTGGGVIPVANHGDIRGDWTSLTRRDNAVLHLYSFRSMASVAGSAGLAHDSVAMSTTLPDARIVFDVRRNNHLYLAGHLTVTNAVANVSPARRSVRVVRIPLLLGAAGRPIPTTDSNLGFLDTFFGRSAPSDAPGDLVSYELPSIAVTAAGDMVMVYGRIPVQTAAPLYPEARYTVYYADSRGPRRSRVLQAGEWMPTTLADASATTPTVTTFFDGPRKLDHTSAVVDPVDDRTVWMAAAFADSSRMSGWSTTCTNGAPNKCKLWRSMVIGRVKP